MDVIDLLRSWDIGPAKEGEDYQIHKTGDGIPWISLSQFETKGANTEEKFRKFEDDLFEELNLKAFRGEPIEDSYIEKRFCAFLNDEKIFISDGKQHWNPYKRPIRPRRNRGNEHKFKGLLIDKDLKRRNDEYKNEIRRLKRYKKQLEETGLTRGYRICPICHEEFYSVRSDAIICPKWRCKKAAQRKGLRYRKKVTSSSSPGTP